MQCMVILKGQTIIGDKFWRSSIKNIDTVLEGKKGLIKNLSILSPKFKYLLKIAFTGGGGNQFLLNGK